MDSQFSSNRRHCFREEDDGLASIAGYSGHNTMNHGYGYGYPINHHTNMNNPFVCYNNNNNGSGMMMQRRNSLRNMSNISSCISSFSSNVFSPRSGRVFDEIHTPHFLESCALCNKPLGGNRDIFMYRGDTPFCSEECRQEQIEMDEAKEKNRNFKALRSKKEAKKSSTSKSKPSSSSSSPSKTQNYPFRTGTVAAA